MATALHHRGKRNIHGIAKNFEGADVPFVFKPGTTVEFDDETAAKIKRLYGHEVVSMDDVQRTFSQSVSAQSTTEVQAKVVEDNEKKIAEQVEARTAEAVICALVAAGFTEDEAKVMAAKKEQPSVESPQEPAKGSVLDRLGVGKKKA